MLFIKNGTLIDPESGRLYLADLEISEGKINKICEKKAFCQEATPGDEVIDAKGLMIAPGLADTHVHFRDPGFTYKEDILSGGEAAKKGGFTQIVLMANTKPPVDNPEILAYVLEKGK